MAAGSDVFFSEKLARRRLTLPYKRELRAKAETAIDQLITLIDAIDGDPDFEPELAQSVAGTAWENQFATWVAPAVEGDSNEDLEPTTASDDVRQRDCWFTGANDDNEPSLGSSNSTDQTHWGETSTYTDAEEVCEDEGAQCDDEGDVTYKLDCGDSPFAMDQTGVRWAFGEGEGSG